MFFRHFSCSCSCRLLLYVLNFVWEFCVEVGVKKTPIRKTPPEMLETTSLPTDPPPPRGASDPSPGGRLSRPPARRVGRRRLFCCPRPRGLLCGAGVARPCVCGCSCSCTDLFLLCVHVRVFPLLFYVCFAVSVLSLFSPLSSSPARYSPSFSSFFLTSILFLCVLSHVFPSPCVRRCGVPGGYACFCPMPAVGTIRTQMDESDWLFNCCCINPIIARSLVRRNYNIEVCAKCASWAFVFFVGTPLKPVVSIAYCPLR